VRKYYLSDDKCKLSLTVSMGKHYYTVTELAGLDARDAILNLRNEGVLINTVYEYSDAPSGTVISTSPRAGYAVYDGEPVVLRISLGKQKLSVSVPDLYSLTEAQARELLGQKRLKLGEISYAVSSQPSAVIIAQQYAPYSKVELDTAVNVTVSIGNGYVQRKVPDLYGLTPDEARARLAEYGLVLGGIYTVTSGAPKGTVVAQTPVEGTPLTSSITSVDIFISS
jgi:serine/threonine-protein kinase